MYGSFTSNQWRAGETLAEAFPYFDTVVLPSRLSVCLCLFTSKDAREAFVCLFVTVKLHDKLMSQAESAPWL